MTWSDFSYIFIGFGNTRASGGLPMRALKLLFFVILAILWWLTVNGYHSAPLDRRWFVFLLGTTVGFVLGCWDSRHTYNYGGGGSFQLGAWRNFPTDCFWMLAASVIVAVLVNIHLHGLVGIWFGGGMLLTFLYFAWPRSYSKRHRE